MSVEDQVKVRVPADNQRRSGCVHSPSRSDELGLGVLQILLGFLLDHQVHVCDLVPDLRVDPQGARQSEAGPGAGDPAAQRAGHGADDPAHPGQLLQAHRTERVVAVEDPWDPVAARVLVAAHDTFERLVQHHGD